LRESSFFSVFSLSTCFSAFCSSCLRNGDFWDVSRILEKRARASSCRCCHCAPWHIHPEVFFFFFQWWKKKKFRLNEKRQNSLFRVEIPGTFPALVVTLLLLSDAHTHTKGAI
jgi:hypothetical protein